MIQETTIAISFYPTGSETIAYPQYFSCFGYELKEGMLIVKNCTNRDIAFNLKDIKSFEISTMEFNRSNAIGTPPMTV